MLSFVFFYLGMLALGLSLEAMITLLTPKFIPYFVFTLVCGDPQSMKTILFPDSHVIARLYITSLRLCYRLSF